jgi:hypothetical protein
MAGFTASLSSPDLIAVIEYVASLNGITNPTAAHRTRARGPPAILGCRSRLRRCSACHQVNGIGISVAVPMALISASVPELRTLPTPQVSTANSETYA